MEMLYMIPYGENILPRKNGVYIILNFSRGSRSVGREEFYLLKCKAVQSVRIQSMFRRKTPLPSSG
jgi:hypothetical protein